MPGLCVLLVVEDELIANRISTLVGTACSVMRFSNSAEAEAWFVESPRISLVIADKRNEHHIVTMVRRNVDYGLTPILITCRSKETQIPKTTIMDGVTDMLVINEDNYAIQSKISYYLKLTNRMQAYGANNYIYTVNRFRLPWWKRTIDILVSFLILLILSPVLLLVAILIKLDSRGPVFYKSKRAGANYYVFNMYKFRTMSASADKLISNMASHNIYATEEKVAPIHQTNEFLCSACRAQGVSCQSLLFDKEQPICEKQYLLDNEKSAKFMKFRNDPRITRLGTFLRNSSIDELPQLLNILLGDMSLVGNRPLPLYEAEKLTSDEFARRFAGPAGLTGLWQVKKRAKGQTAMSDRERTFLDIEYANTFSFKTDIYIMWRTLFSLWQKENV
ncbi:sugar transferase [Spirosoma daeguense]